MSTRARLQNANDSKSLWNYTLSPGWSEFDAHILRLAVMRYGCGAWRAINRHFPLKTCGQLNLQTQRLFGQQALAEFNKVHIDPSIIKEKNDKIDGFRKNTCLINTGKNVSAEERERRRQAHIEKYGIPKDLYTQIRVPVVVDPPNKCKSVIDDIEKLRELYRALYDIQLRIGHLRANNGNNAANIAVKAKQQKNKSSKKSTNKNKKKVEEKNNEDQDVEMVDNHKNEQNIDSDVEITKVVENSKNDEVKEDKVDDSDVEVVKVVEAEAASKSVVNGGSDGMFVEDMDEETAMALALSASMAQTNINTPAIEKKARSKKKTGSKKKTSTTKKRKKGTKSSKKKKGSRKRKNMDSDGDEPYVPTQPKRKRVKRK